jgi:tRNA 2-selenouridine synthase
MIRIVDPAAFLELRHTLPAIDVRSPGEFSEGHIPKAVNMPLFDDEERSIVGTLYKNAGREAAILEGLGFAGKKMKDLVKQAWRIAPSRKVLVHCWRGGMRSESVAWLLSTAGFEVYLLQGGYKAYRKYIREEWARECQLVVLAGKTGAGKTEILQHIGQMGQQVLDLEKIACHKGSAFGAIGEKPQPTNEQFENNLADAWLSLDFLRPIWIEDESRFIGKVNIPEALFKRKQSSLTICVEMPVALRIDRLTKDYANYPKETLLQSLTNISRRIGGNMAKIAAEAIEKEDFFTAIAIVLTYYDKTYAFDLEKKEGAPIMVIETTTADALAIARQVVEKAAL